VSTSSRNPESLATSFQPSYSVDPGLAVGPTTAAAAAASVVSCRPRLASRSAVGRNRQPSQPNPQPENKLVVQLVDVDTRTGGGWWAG